MFKKVFRLYQSDELYEIHCNDDSYSFVDAGNWNRLQVVCLVVRIEKMFE